MNDSEKVVETDSKNSGDKRKHLIVLLSLLLVVAVAGCGYWFWQYKKTSNDTPQAKQRQLVGQLDKVAIRPNEEPVISTVMDASKLTNKTLARQARDGDTLFIFAKSHRIILYRTSEHKVVDMLTIQPK